MKAKLLKKYGIVLIVLAIITPNLFSVNTISTGHCKESKNLKSAVDFWYDTFVNTSKIDYMENITVENGDANFACSDEHTVALWHFNEGSGTTTYDETPNNNDGTIYGASWTAGKFGGALSFDGVDDYIEVPSSNSLNITTNITIEAWIKNQKTSRIESVLSKGGYELKIGTDEKVKFNLFTGSEAIADIGSLGSGSVTSLGVYHGKLYAGASSGTIYRYEGGTTWISMGSLGNIPYALTVLDNTVYALGHNPATIYRYDGNSTWTNIGSLGKTVSHALVVYNGALYAEGSPNADVYRYDGGTIWTKVGSFGEKYGYALIVYNGKLYLGTYDTYPGAVYRYDGGTNWTKVGTLEDGVMALAVYSGKLYAGVYPSGTVYRYDGGTTWTNIGKLTGNDRAVSFAVYNGKLYAGGYLTANLYRYDGGTTWTSIGKLGSSTWLPSFTVYDGKLYAGTDYEARVYSIGDGLTVYSNNQVSDQYDYVVGTYDGTTAKIYFNGVLENSISKTITIDTNSLAMLIGSSHGSEQGGVAGTGDENFDGEIDEVRISNIARTTFDYYNTFGTITSEEIHLPANTTWNTLYINKTEPENTYINVSVVDGKTNQTIAGYENLNQTIIGLSTINTNEHPTIRLKANFSGNGTATPLLHCWSVNWTRNIDLAIDSSDISFSDLENENITINAVVHNLGNDTAENVFVQFLVNELQIENDLLINSIPSGSSQDISINWTPPFPGGYIITVVVDPNNLISELNETNNNASKIIDIPPQYDIELSLLSNVMQGINPGESAVYTIAVLNLGNANDTVYINASVAPPSWGVLLTKQTVILSAGFYPGNSTDFSLIITAPDDAGVNEIANVVVTAVSQGDPDEKDEVTTITIAKPTYCIVVTCLNNNTHYTDPNVVTEYELGILNYGRENENDTIELELSGVSSHWTAELSAESVILGYRNFTTVMLSVTPPSNASALSSCAMTVEARSMFDVNLCNSTTLTTCVNQLYSLEYNYSEWVRVDPGSEFNITVYVKNSGNGQDVLSFIVMNSPSGWVVTAPGQLILNQSENRNITISIYVPKFTLNGNYSVVVNCTNLAKTYMLGLNLTINKIFELEITTPFETKYICPNKTAAILFKITNTGNCFDMVNLSYDAPDTWNPEFCYNGSETTNITLNMNETKELVLNITPVELGIYDIVVKCQSKNNLSVNASKTITVYVELPKLQITNISYPSNIREGDIVPVVAVIRNTGNVSAEGVIVWLFVDDEKIPYNNTFAIITSGSSVYATLYWTAKAGTYIFKVSIVLEEGVEEVFVSEQVIVKPKEHAIEFNLLYLLIIPAVLVPVLGFVIYRKRGKKRAKLQVAVAVPLKEPAEGVIHVKPIEESKFQRAIKLPEGYQCPFCGKKFVLGIKDRPVKIKCIWCGKDIEVSE